MKCGRRGGGTGAGGLRWWGVVGGFWGFGGWLGGAEVGGPFRSEGGGWAVGAVSGH